MQAYQLLPTLGQWAMTGATRHGPSCALPAPAINHTAQGARKVSNAVTKAGAGLCRRESPSHNGGGGLCLVWSVARPIRAGLVPTPGFFLGFFCINFPQATPVRSTRRSSSISHWGLSTLLSDLQRMHGGEQKLETNHSTLPPSPWKELFQIPVGRCCCWKDLNTQDSQDPQHTMTCSKCLLPFGKNTVRLLRMDYRR